MTPVVERLWKTYFENTEVETKVCAPVEDKRAFKIMEGSRAVARLQNKTRQILSAEGTSRRGDLGAGPPQKIFKSRGSEMLF